MCTAVTYQTKDFYFGRTLDHTISYAEEVTITPQNFPLTFRHQPTLEHHYAIIGMAHVIEDYPLYFDAVNERGLAAAGLNFVDYACYHRPTDTGDNVAHFERIPGCIRYRALPRAKASISSFIFWVPSASPGAAVIPATVLK